MTFPKFFRLELSRFISGRKLIILLFIFLFSIYLIQSGIGQYKSCLEEKKSFQEFEKIRVDNFQYYDQYGTYGFRLIFVPSPLSALFNNAGIIASNLNAFIDAGERMKIYESFKGKDSFIGYTSIFLNLTGFIVMFGSLSVLFIGLNSLHNNEFLKFLDGILDRRKIFLYILTSRLIFLFLCCFSMMISTWILYLINGIGVDLGKLMIYFSVAFLMLVFFLLAGMIAGTLKSIRNGNALIFVLWLFFIFLLPAILGKIVYNRADSIMSTYKMEIEKFKIMMSIEKKAKEQAGKLDRTNTNTEIRQQLFEYFWNNEFQDIFKYEKTMIKEMKKVIALNDNISLVLPSTFFLSVNNEISSRGYDNLIDFYEYASKLKMGFIQYYAKESFYLGEKTVKSYLKGDENIFYASGKLPGEFGFGVVISLFWICVLSFFYWIALKHMLDRQPEIKTFPGEEKNVKRKEMQVEYIKENKITVVFTFDPFRLYELYRKLKPLYRDVLMVPGPDSLPGDVKVNTFFHFFDQPVPESLEKMDNEYCGNLSLDDKALIILELVKKLPAQSLIFNQFLTGLSDKIKNIFLDFLEAHKKGRKIVYFSNSLSGLAVGGNVIKFENESYPI